MSLSIVYGVIFLHVQISLFSSHCESCGFLILAVLATMRCLLATNDMVVIVIGKKEKMLAPLEEREFFIFQQPMRKVDMFSQIQQNKCFILDKFSSYQEYFQYGNCIWEIAKTNNDYNILQVNSTSFQKGVSSKFWIKSFKKTHQMLKKHACSF